MRNPVTRLLVLASLLFSHPLFSADGFPPVRPRAIVSGLASPLGVVSASDGSGRLFIVERGGRIRIWDGGQLRNTDFLNVGTLISCCGERGLLGLAFHPDYPDNGLFFINYTEAGSGDTIVERYSVSEDPNVANSSGVVILRIGQPEANHNGGDMHFGPDGYLYIATGDGGGSGDPANRAQNLGDLLGKILRIDVNSGTYAVPASNPFTGVAGARGEIWAYGLRNPWRFSFDRATGDLFIGDVGQGAREEINYQAASSPGGQNYGWRRMEGTLCYNPSTNCNDGSLTLPILDYGRSLGFSVTGGYRYRGSRNPRLQGLYIFGDFGSGRIWAARQSTNTWQWGESFDSSLQIASFGEGENGELYIAHLGGSIHQLMSRAIPSDFNGDGLTEPTIYRNGAWLKFGAGQNVWTGQTSAQCIPAPADYDGDGVVDLSMLCNGAWHFFNSNGTYRKGIWTGGRPGDLPAPADFDADGTDEVVVYGNGAWRFYDFDSGVQTHGVWTGPGAGTQPVPMDHDGDGNAEFAVYDRGAWHFFNDNGSYVKGIWTGGASADIPVPGDYDGDGRDEVVVFRNGAWRFYDFTTGAHVRGVWTGANSFNGEPLQPAPVDRNGDGALEFSILAGGPWHFYHPNGTYETGIWTGGVAGDQAISRRQHVNP